MKGMSRPIIQGDPRIRLVENVEEHESVLTLTYMKTVNNIRFINNINDTNRLILDQKR